MDKETFKRLSNECDITEYMGSEESWFEATEPELLAFAQACFKEGCDWQKKQGDSK